MHWQRHKGGAQHYRVAERLGRRLDVAVALSPEPVLTYCATAPETNSMAASTHVNRVISLLDFICEILLRIRVRKRLKKGR